MRTKQKTTIKENDSIRVSFVHPDGQLTSVDVTKDMFGTVERIKVELYSSNKNDNEKDND